MYQDNFTTTDKPASEVLEHMEGEITRIMKSLKCLRNKVRNDDLTGLLRRDEFFARLARHVQGGQGSSVSILMMDIDDFKILNDQEGHQAGDVALMRTAKVISRCSKIGAVTGRYGGEEFIVAVYGAIQSGTPTVV